MRALESQLIQAYLTEEKIYSRVFEVVNEQNQLMETDMGPAAVMEKARQVEELMGRIGEVEQAIVPAKKAWLSTQRARSEELDRILRRIQGLIEATSETQKQVRDKLLKMIGNGPINAGRPQTGVLADKARLAYGG